MRSFKERRAARALAKANQKEKSSNLQDWLTKRKEASEKAAKEARIERDKKPRGVNRVPEHLQGLTGATYKSDVHHNDDNYQTRRAMGKMRRDRYKRVPRETLPFYDKAESTKGPAQKVYTRGGSNQPYYKPQ